MRTRYPQKETRRDMMAITTMPTLEPFRMKEVPMTTSKTHLQLRDPPLTLARACPPRMQFKIEKPTSPRRFKMQMTMTPK